MIKATEILACEQDRISFMKGIIAIAKIGGVEPSELVFFEKAMESLSVREEAVRHLVLLLTGGEEIPLDLTFTGKRQALFLLKEAIQLCHVDDRYSPLEQKLIAQMADHLKIRPESVKAIETWVAEGMAWSERGDVLVELEA